MKVGEAIAYILGCEGVDTLIGYPVSPLIEPAAAAGIRPIIVRQERTGLHMADSMSRMTSGKRIGVFTMQSGPGTENAFGGVAQAYADSVPILVIAAGHDRREMTTPPNFSAYLNYRNVTKWIDQLVLPETGRPDHAARVRPAAQRPAAAGPRRGPVGRLVRGLPRPDRLRPADHGPVRAGPGGRGARRGRARRRRAPDPLRRPGRPLRRGLARAPSAGRAARRARHHQPPGQERLPGGPPAVARLGRPDRAAAA